MIRYARAKIKGKVTLSNPDYEGSIGIGWNLLKASGIHPWEMVIINHQTAGRSWQTYVMPLDEDDAVEMRGGAAYFAGAGDRVVIIAEELATTFMAPEKVKVVEVK